MLSWIKLVEITSILSVWDSLFMLFEEFIFFIFDPARVFF